MSPSARSTVCVIPGTLEHVKILIATMRDGELESLESWTSLSLWLCNLLVYARGEKFGVLVCDLICY